jgi:hypothetical protein
VALGEKIGDAYIRIHADGHGFDRDIRDDFDNLGDSFDEFGKEHAERYNEAFNKEQNRQWKVRDKEQIAHFEEFLGQMEARTKRFTPLLENDVRNAFERIFKDKGLADIATRNLAQDIADGLRSVGDDNLFDGLEAQMRRAERDWAKVLDDAFKENREFDRKVSADRDRMFDHEHKRLAEAAADWEEKLTEAYRLNHEFDLKRRQDMDKTFELEHRLNAERAKANQDAFNTELNMMKIVEDFRTRELGRNKALIRENQERLKELEGVYDRLRQGTHKYGETVEDTQRKLEKFTEHLKVVNSLDRDTEKTLRHMRTGLLTMTPKLNRVNHKWNEFGDVVGRVTGRGSRNNFLHFVGSVNRGIVRMTGSLAFGFAKLTAVTGGFFQELANGRLKFGDFVDILKLGGKQLIGGIASLGAFVAVISLIATVAGVATAAVSGLVGILLALASTVAFGVIGALAPLVGLIAPLAAGIIATVIAVSNLKKSLSSVQKKELKPVIDGFKDWRDRIREVFIDGLFKNMKTFKAAFKNLGPFVEAGAHGMVRALVDLADAFASPEFGKFTKVMEKFIPNALDSLGRSLGNVITGLAGVFRALLPVTREFLKWLEKITGEFSDWANSKKGQKELRDFFDKAAESAKVLGRFLGTVIKLFATLLDQSNQTGNNIFDDMTNALKKVIKWLKSPEGKQAMKDWLKWAEDFSKDLGDLIVNVVDLIDKLDTPSRRKNAETLVKAFGKLLEILARLPGLVTAFADGIYFSIGVVIELIDKVKEVVGWFQRLGTEAGRFVATIQGHGTGGPDVIGWFQDLGVWVARFMQTINNADLGTFWRGFLRGAGLALVGLRNVATSITDLPGIRDVWAAVTQRGREFMALVNHVRSLISSMPSPKDIFAAVIRRGAQFVNLLETIITKVKNIPVVSDIFGKVVDAGQFFLGLVERIIAALGSISVHINWPDPPGWLSKVTGINSGGSAGTTDFPGTRASGDGRIIGGGGGSDLVGPSFNRGGRQIVVPQINVFAAQQDAAAVAQETLNRIVGAGY